jgi:hypothetical protein
MVEDKVMALHTHYNHGAADSSVKSIRFFKEWWRIWTQEVRFQYLLKLYIGLIAFETVPHIQNTKKRIFDLLLYKNYEQPVVKRSLLHNCPGALDHSIFL